MKGLVVCLLCATLFSPECAGAQEWQVKGEYRNPAEGYSINIPHGLSAVTGVSGTGAQRGVKISLPSGGTISVWGEPNSLEWKNPSEGVQWELENGECVPQEARPSPVLVGRIEGVQSRAVCKDHVQITILAFRPGGEPIYWFELTTTSANEHQDKAVLDRVAASFKIIRWK